MISIDDIKDLYPFANTKEKVTTFVSCAAKQGRQSVRIKTFKHIARDIYDKGFFIEERRETNIEDVLILTISWEGT